MVITPIHSGLASTGPQVLVGVRVREALRDGLAIGCAFERVDDLGPARAISCLVETTPPQIVPPPAQPVRAEWLADLCSPNSARRYSACETFDASLDEVASLLALLAFDTEWEVRAAAVQAMDSSAKRRPLDRAMLTGVAYLIGDEHSVVRDSAFALIVQQNDPVALLTQLLAERRRRDEGPLVHSLRLSRFSSRLPAGLAGLHLQAEAASLLGDQRPAVRVAMLEALLWSEVRVDPGLVSPLTTDPASEVADAAAQLLDEWSQAG